MNENKEKMPVRYKRLDSGQGTDFNLERSLDLIFSPGCFTVEIDHSAKDVGLPIEFCGSDHYIVGTLMVTDNGVSNLQPDKRLTGQALIFTSRKSKETKVYTRTYADGLWSEWSSLVRAGMYNNISTTDKLLATVESLVDENTRAKEVEESVKRTAVDISSLTCTADKENVTITANSMNGEVLHSVEIPVATTENAGVMSADILNAIAVNAELIENKVIYATGNISTNAYFDTSDYIAIPNGIIDLSASGWIAGGAQLVAFYDAAKTFISGYGNFGDAKATFYSAIHLQIPENAKFIRYCSSRTENKTIVVWGNKAYNKNIEALLPISIEWIDGEFVNRGGVIANNAAWCRSDYIYVADIAGVTIKAYNHSTVLACAFYDADYKYISGVGDLGYTTFTVIHTNVVVPANARYMRVSTAVAYKNDTVFYANGMRNIATEKEDSTEPDIETTQIIPANFYRKQSDDSLRILCFGSSWLTNTWWYLNKMTNAVGINATIKCYFSSACPFSKWIDRYEEREETGVSTDFRRFDSVNGSDWSVEYVTDVTEFRHSLEDDWDVIVFQQGVYDNTYWDTTNGYANHYEKLMSYIKRSVKPWTVICYNNTWTPKLGASQTLTKEAQKEWQRLNNENCIRFTNLVGLSNFVIPCGSAVWALRNDTVITSVDDFVSVENNTATYSDNLHLKNGLPLYLTGLTLFRSIITPFYGIDIDEITWLPDESTEKNPASGKSWMPIDSEQAARLKDMVKLAFSNRYGFYTL